MYNNFNRQTFIIYINTYLVFCPCLLINPCWINGRRLGRANIPIQYEFTRRQFKFCFSINWSRALFDCSTRLVLSGMGALYVSTAGLNHILFSLRAAAISKIYNLLTMRKQKLNIMYYYGLRFVLDTASNDDWPSNRYGTQHTTVRHKESIIVK